MKQLVARAIAIAQSRVGIREVGSSNTGTAVNHYLAQTGLGPGNPWCLAFVYAAIDDAAEALALRNPLLRTGSCSALQTWARDEGIAYDVPAAGDILLLLRPRAGTFRAHHCGLVASVEAGNRSVGTVEGNTNADGSAEGFEVLAKQRPVSNLCLFVRWADLAPEPGVATMAWSLSGRAIGNAAIRDGRAWLPVATWAEALGFTSTWDAGEQVLKLDGRAVGVTTALVEGEVTAPLRELAQAAGLRVSVDSAARAIQVTR